MTVAACNAIPLTPKPVHPLTEAGAHHAKRPCVNAFRNSLPTTTTHLPPSPLGSSWLALYSTTAERSLPQLLHRAAEPQNMSNPSVTISPYPSVSDDRRPSYPDEDMSASSNSSITDIDHPMSDDTNLHARPSLGSRKSSGTIIVPRDSPNIELKEEEYEQGDARTMSPRRSSEEIEKMGQDARQALIE